MHAHQIQQLNVSQDLHKQHKKQAAQTELGLKVKLEELEKRYQDELRRTKCSLEEMELTVQEFTAFTMVHVRYCCTLIAVVNSGTII